MKKEIKETEERLYAVNCGKRIRKLREQKGLTQEELAEIVHCSAVSLGRIERGQQNIKLWRLEILCDLFHVSLDYFYRGIEPAEQSEVPSYLIKLFQDANELEYTILSEQMLSVGRMIDYIRTAEGRFWEGRLQKKD